MKILDTIYISNEDGTAVWFSPETSQSSVTTQNTKTYETRKIIRADDGNVLKLGDEILGSQIWLKDDITPENLVEVKAEDVKEDDELLESTNDDELLESTNDSEETLV